MIELRWSADRPDVIDIVSVPDDGPAQPLVTVPYERLAAELRRVDDDRYAATGIEPP